MAAIAPPLPTSDMSAISDTRREAFDSVMGTTLAEGVAPSPTANLLFEKYANGEITLAEMTTAVNAIYGI